MNEQLPGPEAANDHTRRAGPPADAGLIGDVAMGLRFYSRLPIKGAHEPPDLSRMAPALPFTSLAIGLGPAALLAIGTSAGLPSVFAGGLAVAVLVVLTGAMAEDGLADAADGLFGGHTSERRLEIMRDSRHGTYGVAALCLYLLLRVLAIGAIAAASPLAGAAVWLAAMVISRSGSLLLPLLLLPARPDGASASAGQVSRPSFLIGAGFAAILALLLASPVVGLVGALLALVAAGAVAFICLSLCRRLVGGHTGDLIGAVQALLELGALTVFLAFA